MISNACWPSKASRPPRRGTSVTLTPRTSRALALACGVLAAACARANKDPLAQPDGEWLFVNYWAEWCKPCIEEIPRLNAFHREQAGKARVVMVNFDGASGAALQEQAKALGIETTIFEGEPSARFGFRKPEVLPSTYVICTGSRPTATRRQRHLNALREIPFRPESRTPPMHGVQVSPANSP
jgi:thiol-disulfide isomerase/thioredoxin